MMKDLEGALEPAAGAVVEADQREAGPPGSLPGRGINSVDVGLHQKTRPTYLSRASEKSLLN